MKRYAELLSKITKIGRSAPPPRIDGPLGQRLAQVNKEIDRLLQKREIDSEFEALYWESREIQRTIVDRNFEAYELERRGNIKKAITLYELNVHDEVDTPFPYERLAAIYGKSKQFDDEVRILEKAAQVFPEDEKLRIQLEKAKAEKIRESTS
ncbi:MAG: hypothetical protein A2Y91_06395 [Chloroflexi bacterium RBG_13_54_8]|nr:MAG: hypothetical protein A2Y91_06395 [Chloroflexi bacterium RBG_13_54_8]